jgi:hypothetical protein
MKQQLKSNMCHQAQMESPEFMRWVPPIAGEFRLHRKLWEFCYISQALHERGMLCPGRTGLGFGVGMEPLAELFASHGCRIVATDQDEEEAKRTGWADAGQHASRLEQLNERYICPPEQFRRLVSFRTVDMRAIPDDLRGFDFTWSSCCFEHLGSIENGFQFILDQMACLKPGGIAVHTTELNVSSNKETLDHDPFLVLFRRRDFEHLGRRLRWRGHSIELDFTPGNLVADNYVDNPPFRQDLHLRLNWDKYVTTSFGLIIRKRALPGASILRRALRLGA